MSEHPIQGLMRTAMEQITEMVNVNTIVGDGIETGDGSVILPISRVGFGFAAGGSEFKTDAESMQKNDTYNASVALPFGGGSGGGVSITPIAFLVVGNSGVKVVPLDNQTHIYERLIDLAPQVVDKIQSMLKKGTMAAGAGANMMGGASGGMGAGSMAGGMPGATGGMTGQMGGMSGGNAGGMSGGNAGGMSGGNAGGMNGGNTGGMSGGNAGGMNGGNAGGMSGGNAGGMSGGNAGAMSGGNAGGGGMTNASSTNPSAVIGSILGAAGTAMGVPSATGAATGTNTTNTAANNTSDEDTSLL